MENIISAPVQRSTVSAPIEKKDRIAIIDSIRGVALLGILLMNIPYFSAPYQFAYNLELRNELTGPNYNSWWIVNGAFEGTMRALFSMLFGAGSLLLLTRLEKKDQVISAADIYYRRLIWLLIFGVFNAFILLWPGDILYSYAICGLFLFPFRNMKARHLMYIGIAFMLIWSLKGTMHWKEARDTRIKGEQVLALEKQKVKLNDQQQEDKAKWTGMQERLKKENVLKAASKEQQKISDRNYINVLLHLRTVNMKLESVKFYNDLFWDVMAFLFIGMALFKWGVLTGQRSLGLYMAFIVIGYSLGLLISYQYNHTALRSHFDPTRTYDTLKVNLYQFKRILLALGHLGVIMVLYKLNAMTWFLKAMARVGQMAFSNYLMQSIICTLIFYGYGLRWFGQLERYETYYVVFGVWAYQILFSIVWLKYFRFGPFEWVWRSLTYWKKQPFIKS